MQGDLYKQQQQEELHIQQDQEQLQRQEQLLAAPQEMVEGAAHLEASQATMAAQQLQAPVTEEQQASMGKFQRRREKRKAKKEYKERDRLEKEEIARQATLESSVVDGISKEEAEEHGVASFHHTLTEEKARVVVKHANGFLYAKPNGDGTAELKPTLPETLTVVKNGKAKQVQFRRNVNLINRLLARRCLDEKGKLREGALEFFRELAESFASLSGELAEANWNDHLNEIVDDQFAPIVREEYPPETAPQVVADLKNFFLMTQSCSGDAFASPMSAPEIYKAWQNFVESCDATETPLNERLAAVRRAMQAENQAKGAQALPDDELESEIQEKLDAVTAMYADAYTARAELHLLRDINLDTKDVALPNACSANGAFIDRVFKLQDANRRSFFQYNTSSFVSSHPLQALQWALKYPPTTYSKKEKEQLDDAISALTLPEGSAEQWKHVTSYLEKTSGFKKDDPKTSVLKQFKETLIQNLSSITANSRKYLYHVAGHIGTMKDHTGITLETFAAETTQLTVSPITTHIAVGRYMLDKNGAPIGMTQYYDHDVALPDAQEIALAKVKDEVNGHRLPGDAPPR